MRILGGNSEWRNMVSKFIRYCCLLCTKFHYLIDIMIDIVLEDFCTVANMTTDLNFHERHYLRNVFYEQVGEMELPKSCGAGVPLDSRATECTLLAKPSSVDISDSDDENPSSDGVLLNVGRLFLLSTIASLLFL